MDIRDTRGPQLEQAPEIVVSHAPTVAADQQDRPVLIPDADPPRAARSRRWMLAGLAALVVLVAGAGRLAAAGR